MGWRSSMLRLSILIILASIAIFGGPAQGAGRCIPNFNESSIKDTYSYLYSFIDSLGYARDALNYLQSPQTQTELQSMLFSLTQAANKLSCGQNILTPYSNSSHKAIKASADSGAAAFGLLADIQHEKIREVRNHLDAGKANPGSYVERLAELSNQENDIWKSLVDSALLATYTISAEGPQSGLMSRSSLTVAQHQQLLRELRSDFGTSIIKDTEVDQPAYLSAAALLYQVLIDPNRVKSDQ